MNYEIIEWIDPAPDTMIRTFHCHICDKTHLQTGRIARIWVLYQEGYSSNAAEECVLTAEQKVTGA